MLYGVSRDRGWWLVPGWVIRDMVVFVVDDSRRGEGYWN